MASAVSRSLVGTDGRNVRPAVTRARSAPAGPPGRLARGGAGPGGSAGAPSGCGRRAAFSPRAGADELRRAMLARGAALRRTGLLCGRGGGRGLWTGRPQSGTLRDPGGRRRGPWPRPPPQAAPRGGRPRSPAVSAAPAARAVALPASRALAPWPAAGSGPGGRTLASPPAPTRSSPKFK